MYIVKLLLLPSMLPYTLSQCAWTPIGGNEFCNCSDNCISLNNSLAMAYCSYMINVEEGRLNFHRLDAYDYDYLMFYQGGTTQQMRYASSAGIAKPYNIYREGRHNLTSVPVILRGPIHMSWFGRPASVTHKPFGVEVCLEANVSVSSPVLRDPASLITSGSPTTSPPSSNNPTSEPSRVPTLGPVTEQLTYITHSPSSQQPTVLSSLVVTTASPSSETSSIPSPSMIPSSSSLTITTFRPTPVATIGPTPSPIESPSPELAPPPYSEDEEVLDWWNYNISDDVKAIAARLNQNRSDVDDINSAIERTMAAVFILALNL